MNWKCQTQKYCNNEVSSISALRSYPYDKPTSNCSAKRKYENEENNKWEIFYAFFHFPINSKCLILSWLHLKCLISLFILQGFNRIAAITLLFMHEEDAFWCLVFIIEHLMPVDYYSRDKQLIGAQVDQVNKSVEY